MNGVQGDHDKDFLFSFEEDPLAFDAVHTFAVARQVLTTYERALQRIGVERFKWHWNDKENSAPLDLFPRANGKKEVKYLKCEKRINFGYFRSAYGDRGVRWVYLCQSFDLIAHEVGHAILHSLKPGYFCGPNAYGKRLKESFSDLAAIFTILAQMDQVEAIIAESKGNLKVGTFLSAIAEQFGLVTGRSTGLNSALGIRNAVSLHRADGLVSGADDHQHSQVFTSALYDVLVLFYTRECEIGKYDPAETLYREGKHLLEIVLGAFIEVDVKDANFDTIAGAMVKLERDRKTEREKKEHSIDKNSGFVGGYPEEMVEVFRRRNILKKEKAKSA
jgi:hypothetical protein